MTDVGTHCVLELYGCAPHLLNDADHILDAMRRAAVASGSTLLGEVSHRFEPQGVTALALLAESHISIHTWPEHGYAAVDVFTCGEHTIPERACEVFKTALEARESQLRKIPRGVGAPASTFRFDRHPASDDASQKEPQECQVLTFDRMSGSTNTSRPGTSTNTA